MPSSNLRYTVYLTHQLRILAVITSSLPQECSICAAVRGVTSRCDLDHCLEHVATVQEEVLVDAMSLIQIAECSQQIHHE